MDGVALLGCSRGRCGARCGGGGGVVLVLVGGGGIHTTCSCPTITSTTPAHPARRHPLGWAPAMRREALPSPEPPHTHNPTPLQAPSRRAAAVRPRTSWRAWCCCTSGATAARATGAAPPATRSLPAAGVSGGVRLGCQHSVSCPTCDQKFASSRGEWGTAAARLPALCQLFAGCCQPVGSSRPAAGVSGHVASPPAGPGLRVRPATPDPPPSP